MNNAQLTTKKETLPVASILEQNAGKGNENIQPSDLAIPMLKILSTMSPQVNKRDGAYVESAEPSMIYNSATDALYNGEKGIIVVPCAYNKTYVEWKERGEGTGAPEAVHPATSTILTTTTRDANNKDRLDNGNYVEETANHYVLILENNMVTQAVVTMKSTQLKKSRKWNSLIVSVPKEKSSNGSFFMPPRFAYSYKLKTVSEANDKGNWFGWEITRLEKLSDAELINQAAHFADAVAKGDAVAKVEEGPQVQQTKKPQTKQTPF